MKTPTHEETGREVMNWMRRAWRYIVDRPLV